MAEKRVGVIGGSGLYEMKALKEVREVKVDTPFGKPSDNYILGTLDGIQMVFLPRHGRGHRLFPSELNYRANIYGMKKLGVEWIISISAVGSMREDIRPGDILIPDQFFDRTSKRISTFFGNGIVAHVAFADPICPKLSAFLFSAGKDAGADIHMGGTYMCMEGPQFSTRAESNIYRAWGVNVIGMTNIPEAKLAREAEICYATMALITDYDCWHEHEEDVTIEAVIAIINKNTALAQQIIQGAIKKIPDTRNCICATSLKDAILTSPEYIPAKVKKDLELIIGKYMPKED
jgi:5'-methylthioadenosine phosphorylase